MRFGDYRDSLGILFFQNNIPGSKAKISPFSGEWRQRLAKAAGPTIPSGGEKTPAELLGGALGAGFAAVGVVAPCESRHFFPVPDT